MHKAIRIKQARFLSEPVLRPFCKVFFNVSEWCYIIPKTECSE